MAPEFSAIGTLPGPNKTWVSGHCHYDISKKTKKQNTARFQTQRSIKFEKMNLLHGLLSLISSFRKVPFRGKP
jgi:hypothetical protein